MIILHYHKLSLIVQSLKINFNEENEFINNNIEDCKSNV